MTPSVRDLEALIDRDRLTERLRSLVRIPSENPPGEEAAVAAAVRWQCEELGLEVTEFEDEPGRPSVIARFGEGPPTVGFCSHIDVVPAGDHSLWKHEPYGAVIENGQMHGRGSSDAKGPVAAALEAVSALGAAGIEGSLELSLVADEETM